MKLLLILAIGAIAVAAHDGVKDEEWGEHHHHHHREDDCPTPVPPPTPPTPTPVPPPVPPPTPSNSSCEQLRPIVTFGGFVGGTIGWLIGIGTSVLDAIINHQEVAVDMRSKINESFGLMAGLMAGEYDFLPPNIKTGFVAGSSLAQSLDLLFQVLRDIFSGGIPPGAEVGYNQQISNLVNCNAKLFG